MLDELFPVQFVEGLNEGAEQLDEETIVITQYLGIGLQYVPQVSYSLTRLEIMITFGDLPKEAQITVGLCSDYDDKPSDIVLTSGSFVPKGVYGGWQEVILKPVSVIRGKKYWVTINPNGCPTALIRAEKGKGCLLIVRMGKKWKAQPEDIKDGRVMLKLYGRILPLSTS